MTRPHRNSDRSSASIGRRVADLLAGAWRQTPPAVDPATTELASISTLLCSNGAAALAWRRVRQTELAASAAGAQLHDVYRRFVCPRWSMSKKSKPCSRCCVTAALSRFWSRGGPVRAAIPIRALRPYGDIDICVRPDQFARATNVVKALSDLDGHYVDLHSGFSEIGANLRDDPVCRERINEWNERFARTQLVELDRPASASSAMKITCVCRACIFCAAARGGHRGCATSRWLWNPVARRFAGNSVWVRVGQRQIGVASTIVLAHELLGARLDDTPFARAILPRWLAPAVLRQWGRERDPNERALKLPALLASTERGKIASEIYARWDNPVRATAALNGG